MITSLQSRTKIMHIVARMNVGGPAILLADLVRNLDPVEFEQFVVTGFCDPNEVDYLDSVATDIHPIRIKGLGRSISFFRDLTAFLFLVREIRRIRPQIVHTHTSKAGLLGRLAAFIALPSARRVHTYHGHLLHGYFGKSKSLAFIFIERILAKYTHELIAVGSKVMDDLLRVGVGSVSKFHVIHPGLHEDNIDSKEKCRVDLGLSQEKTFILFIGRLTQIKRPDRLIDVIYSIAPTSDNVHFLVVGGGELLSTTKMEAESNSLPVSFFGWRNDVSKFLGASDIAILCSDNEGVPLSLIQAALAKLPIISTDVGSVTDLVKHGVNGYVTSKNPREIADFLEKLIEDPKLRSVFGEASFEIAQGSFTSKAMMENHKKLYQLTMK